jgi:hypothetical protein
MQNFADPTLLESSPGDEPLPAADPALEHERLRILADYTRFQIGLFTAVAAGVSLLAVWSGVRPWKLIPVFILALAGLAVGVVAGNLLEAHAVASFRSTRIKPRVLGNRGSRLPLLRSYHRWRGWRAERWELLARSGFWLAVVGFLGLALAGAYVPARSLPAAESTPATADAIMPPPIGPATEITTLPPRARSAAEEDGYLRARPAEVRKRRAAKPGERARRAGGRPPEYDGNR